MGGVDDSAGPQDARGAPHQGAKGRARPELGGLRVLHRDVAHLLRRSRDRQAQRLNREYRAHRRRARRFPERVFRFRPVRWIVRLPASDVIFSALWFECYASFWIRFSATKRRCRIRLHYVSPEANGATRRTEFESAGRCLHLKRKTPAPACSTRVRARN